MNCSDETKTLQLSPLRIMRMSDDVLSLRITSDGKYLAVALLDNTIKVFFAGMSCEEK
jgi:U3 small nucleolar RNA-associated protein 12